MYDDENLGSSATEDSCIVTFDSLFVWKEQRNLNTTWQSNRWKCKFQVSCNASHLPENKVTNESHGIFTIHSIQAKHHITC